MFSVSGYILVLIRENLSIMILIQQRQVVRERIWRIGAIPECKEGVVSQYRAGHHRRAESGLSEHSLSVRSRWAPYCPWPAVRISVAEPGVWYSKGKEPPNGKKRRP